SSGLVVAALNAASARSLALVGRRGVWAIVSTPCWEIDDPARRWKLRPGQTLDRRRSGAGEPIEQRGTAGKQFKRDRACCALTAMGYLQAERPLGWDQHFRRPSPLAILSDPS